MNSAIGVVITCATKFCQTQSCLLAGFWRCCLGAYCACAHRLERVSQTTHLPKDDVQVGLRGKASKTAAAAWVDQHLKLKYDLFEFFEGGLKKGLLKLN